MGSLPSKRTDLIKEVLQMLDMWIERCVPAELMGIINAESLGGYQVVY